MNFDEFEKKIMNYPSRQEMISYLDELRETYAKPVYMTQDQREVLLAMKEIEHETLIDGWDVWFKKVLMDIEPDDALRAWLHPEIIKVVE